MDAASLEQMNKLRKSLGLPLLGGAQSESTSAAEAALPKFKQGGSNDANEEPASTLDTREAAGYDNYQKLVEDQRRQKQREERKKQIQKAKNAAEKYARLEGKGLGDTGDDGDLDAKAWLRGQKRRQQDIEEEREREIEQELAEKRKRAEIQYTGADLAGVQVAHEIDDFEGASGQILTLQDQEIAKDGETDEEDVLENADIVAKDKLREKLDAKKKIRYDVHDQEENSLLAQYDEKKRKAFTLDAKGSSLEEREAKRQQIGEKLKNTVSLDILKLDPVSDYQEVKIRKPKSKKKHKRLKEFDEDDIFTAAATSKEDDVQMGDASAPPARRPKETSFNDDEDLASALSFSRRAALKKKKIKPEDLARHLREEEDNDGDINGGDEEGITLDDTRAFLDNLHTRADEEAEAQTRRLASKTPEPKVEGTSPDSDVEMDESVQEARIVNGQESDAILEKLRREQNGQTEASTGIEEEKTLDQGIGAALSLLKERGIIKTSETDPSDKNALHRERQRFMLDQQLREHQSEMRARAQRERDRQAGKHTGMSTREREEQARYANEQRAQQGSIVAAAAFNKEYKPDVNIKYVDDDGRTMNQKEAFKHLSHQFHGKGSGKGKTEKHLKKLADEKRREAKSVLDSSREGDGGSGGLSKALGTMGRRDKVAGVRLQ